MPQGSEEAPAQPNLHWNSQVWLYIERPWHIGSQRVILFSSFITTYYIVLLLPWQRGSFYSVLKDLKNISHCFFFYFNIHTFGMYMIFWESLYSNLYIQCWLLHCSLKWKQWKQQKRTIFYTFEYHVSLDKSLCLAVLFSRFSSIITLYCLNSV